LHAYLLIGFIYKAQALKCYPCSKGDTIRTSNLDQDVRRINTCTAVANWYGLELSKFTELNPLLDCSLAVTSRKKICVPKLDCTQNKDIYHITGPHSLSENGSITTYPLGWPLCLSEKPRDCQIEVSYSNCDATCENPVGKINWTIDIQRQATIGGSPCPSVLNGDLTCLNTNQCPPIIGNPDTPPPVCPSLTCENIPDSSVKFLCKLSSATPNTGSTIVDINVPYPFTGKLGSSSITFDRNKWDRPVLVILSPDFTTQQYYIDYSFMNGGYACRGSVTGQRPASPLHISTPCTTSGDPHYAFFTISGAPKTDTKSHWSFTPLGVGNFWAVRSSLPDGLFIQQRHHIPANTQWQKTVLNEDMEKKAVTALYGMYIQYKSDWIILQNPNCVDKNDLPLYQPSTLEPLFACEPKETIIVASSLSGKTIVVEAISKSQIRLIITSEPADIADYSDSSKTTRITFTCGGNPYCSSTITLSSEHYQLVEGQCNVFDATLSSSSLHWNGKEYPLSKTATEITKVQSQDDGFTSTTRPIVPIPRTQIQYRNTQSAITSRQIVSSIVDVPNWIEPCKPRSSKFLEDAIHDFVALGLNNTDITFDFLSEPSTWYNLTLPSVLGNYLFDTCTLGTTESASSFQTVKLASEQQIVEGLIFSHNPNNTAVVSQLQQSIAEKLCETDSQCNNGECDLTSNVCKCQSGFSGSFCDQKLRLATGSSSNVRVAIVSVIFATLLLLL